jgi:hypothetical protein
VGSETSEVRLTASDAYNWHSSCPCSRAHPRGYVFVKGKGVEGAWAEEWLRWLFDTHLCPRGFELVQLARRVLVVRSSTNGGIAAAREAIVSGPVGRAPEPWRPRAERWRCPECGEDVYLDSPVADRGHQGVPPRASLVRACGKHVK